MASHQPPSIIDLKSTLDIVTSFLAKRHLNLDPTTNGLACADALMAQSNFSVDDTLKTFVNKQRGDAGKDFVCSVSAYATSIVMSVYCVLDAHSTQIKTPSISLFGTDCNMRLFESPEKQFSVNDLLCVACVASTLAPQYCHTNHPYQTALAAIAITQSILSFIDGNTPSPH